MDKKKIVSRPALVINELGMHARPAAKIAEMAAAATGSISLSKGSQSVDASSIIDILTLGAVKGTQILIQADSPADKDVVEKIQAFFDMGFGELKNDQP